MIEKARWIACDANTETPLIRRKFLLKRPLGGEIEITGLGYFELYCNGRRVGDEYFVPALSDYRRRDFARLLYPLHDEFTHRVYFLKYDLSPYLSAGENTLEIVLGNGFYRQTERFVEGDMFFGDALCARYAAKIREADGTDVSLFSDGCETFRATEVTASQLFTGEKQDFRRIAEEARPVHLIDFDAELTLQTCPPDRVVRKIRARRIGTTLYDAGEVVSGFAVLSAVAGEASEIRVTYSEELTPDGGALDVASTGGFEPCRSGGRQVQTDTFLTDGRARRLAPRFVWHAFRYFTVDGTGFDADDVTVEVVHSDVAVTSSFSADHEALNWLYDAYLRTQLDNMHGGVPSDCPHRERLGYTGDGQVTCDAAMLLLDSKAFYEKWIRDILDSQDARTGHVQHTAPFMGGGGGPCGWGGAVIEVPYQYYRHFGGTEKLLHWYPAMRSYVKYILDHSENGLVVREEPGGWCLGDWASVGEMKLPEPFVNSCLFVRFLRELSEIARLLRLNADAAHYDALGEQVRRALLRAYYDGETGSFCGGVQGADAYALDIHLAPDERTLRNLVAKYEALGVPDTGFIGTDVLYDVLFRNGETDLAYRLLTTDKQGGYLWMKRQGATTLYEYPNGAGSHCHPMFGAPVKYLFRYFLGICQHFITEQPEMGEHIRISPRIPRAACAMSGSIETSHGDISVAWSREAGRVEISVGVPEGLRAVFAYGGMETELHPGESRFVFAEN